MKPLQHGARICHGTLMGYELYRRHDSYGDIVVFQRGNKRVLSFGSRLEQSCVLMAKPYYLMHEYTQIMLLALLFTPVTHVTLLGLGGGGLVHCLSHFFPQINIKVVELRQAVIDIAYDWFDLPRTKNVQVIHDDAQHYVSGMSHAATDIIFSDLYEAEGMSSCQAQRDFFAECERALTDTGCLVLNFHKKPDPQSYLMEAVQSLFKQIIVYNAGSGNCIMFCCKQNIALHQPAMNTAAEYLLEKVDMPLMFYYRNLERW